MRLIDADDLDAKIELSIAWVDEKLEPDRFAEGCKAGLKDLRSTVKNHCPTVDAVPVKHGRWIDGTCGCYKICSECDQISDFDFDYCPNCGAKMDEVSE